MASLSLVTLGVLTSCSPMQCLQGCVISVSHLILQNMSLARLQRHIWAKSWAVGTLSQYILRLRISSHSLHLYLDASFSTFWGWQSITEVPVENLLLLCLLDLFITYKDRISRCSQMMEGFRFNWIHIPRPIFVDDIVLLASLKSDIQLTRGWFAP